MDEASAVFRAARERARALAEGDTEGLLRILHPAFRWTSHRGEVFDRQAYVDANSRGSIVWHEQRLEDPVVQVVGETAVLVCRVVDTVSVEGRRRTFRMPVTQTWVMDEARWRCLAGHAGPVEPVTRRPGAQGLKPS